MSSVKLGYVLHHKSLPFTCCLVNIGCFAAIGLTFVNTAELNFWTSLGNMLILVTNQTGHRKETSSQAYLGSFYLFHQCHRKYVVHSEDI